MKYKVSAVLALVVFLLINAKEVLAVDTIPIDASRISPATKSFARVGSDYAPTIMYDGAKYKMWWCGAYTGKNESPREGIWYITSTDGNRWTNPVLALETARPPQGWYGCDPSVVRANGKYWLYYTSETRTVNNFGTNNQVYLATSTDGITWSYANGKAAVLPLPPNIPTTDYGIGQSSLIFKDGKFIQSYNYPGTGVRHVASSTDGIHFTDFATEAGDDMKWLPLHKVYITVANNLSLRVYSEDFTLQKIFTIPASVWPFPCSLPSNAALLGDNKGNIIDENSLTIFWTPGAKTAAGSCTNPPQWDIWQMKVNINGLIGPASTPGPSTPSPRPILPGDVNKDTFVNYADYLLIKSGFNNPYTIFDYNNLISNYGK